VGREVPEKEAMGRGVNQENPNERLWAKAGGMNLQSRRRLDKELLGKRGQKTGGKYQRNGLKKKRKQKEGGITQADKKGNLRK